MSITGKECHIWGTSVSNHLSPGLYCGGVRNSPGETSAFTSSDRSVPQCVGVLNPEQGPAIDSTALLGKVIRITKERYRMPSEI